MWQSVSELTNKNAITNGNLYINKFIMDLGVKNLYFGVVRCPMSRYDTAEEFYFLIGVVP